MKKLFVGLLVSFTTIAQDGGSVPVTELVSNSKNVLERQKMVEEEYKIELIRKRANLEYEKEKMRVMSKPKVE